MKNRAWIFAVSSFPHLINAFVGPIAAQRFHEHGTWRWAYGLFAIFLPVICLPASIILFGRRPRAQDVTHESKSSSQTKWKMVQKYFVESDSTSINFFIADQKLTISSVIGATLIGVAFVMFMLPFSFGILSQTTATAPQLWFMLAFGIAIFPVFVMWEKFLSQVCTVPYHGLLSPTVLGGCISGGTLFISFL